jgi:hypothetical protein
MPLNKKQARDGRTKVENGICIRCTFRRRNRDAIYTSIEPANTTPSNCMLARLYYE